MPTVTIRHVTTYRYRQPVAFGEHRMMLRPRDSHDQRVIEAGVEISPAPESLRFVQDSFGNHVGIARFSGRAQELRFASVVRVEQAPAGAADLDLADDVRSFPVDYDSDETPDLALCIARHHADPDDEVGRWAHRFLPPDGAVGACELLARLARGIQQGFVYRRRETKGIQPPLETLRLRHGSCRDFALLMIEAARSLGLAARFALGYLAVPPGNPPAAGDAAHGSTHAWAQVYLPASGWVDVDPTSGRVGKADLVTVAVVRDPDHATPLHGTFVGVPADHLGMEVRVSITSGPPMERIAVGSGFAVGAAQPGDAG